MQKVLTEMNVQLANVISDISGLTGLAIIQAILGGERDRYKLADLADVRIQATREEIARSLEGNWRKELSVHFAARAESLSDLSAADR